MSKKLIIYKLANLNAEGFNPRWSIPDLAQDEGLPMPDNILKEQTRIEKCDALCMVFPIFWFAMPAIL